MPKSNKTPSTSESQKTDNATGFEQALEALEAIVKQMEQGDLTLEQSLSRFEEGVKLTQSCQKALASASLRVQQLTESSGLFTCQDFDEPSQS
jgi:exodeoxyribonuclease VII small subunit